MGRLMIDGNSVYEIHEECMREKERKEQQEQEKNTSEKQEKRPR